MSVSAPRKKLIKKGILYKYSKVIQFYKKASIRGFRLYVLRHSVIKYPMSSAYYLNPIQLDNVFIKEPIYKQRTFSHYLHSVEF